MTQQSMVNDSEVVNELLIKGGIGKSANRL